MRAIILLTCLMGAGTAQAQGARGPVIDMHLHASRLNVASGVPVCPGNRALVYPAIDPKATFDPDKVVICAKPLYSPTTGEEVMRQSLSELRRHNVRRAVTSGPQAQVAAWRAAAPDLIIPAAGFGGAKTLPVEELRRLHRDKGFAVFAEVSTQYAGVDASDPRYEPYWALAEELDIPVGIHLGESSPGAARTPGYETYRARLTSPFQLEEVLFRHPSLRVYVMHYGSPLVDEMIAMLFTHANLYVDVAANDWNMPRTQFHDHLKRLVDAGFGKRIMFGSDQTIWPQAIGEAIDGIDSAPFLSAAQKRDIFYDNAARFLRLSPAEIAADHARQPPAFRR